MVFVLIYIFYFLLQHKGIHVRQGYDDAYNSNYRQDRRLKGRDIRVSFQNN